MASLVAEAEAVVAKASYRSSLEHINITESALGLVICDGPGSLHSVLISNAGCCNLVLRDGNRSLFRMLSAFSGSFFLEAGFNEKLIIDIWGEMAAHLDISYRKA